MPAIRDTPPWVYFIRRADGVGPVKIGCSQRPEDRLSSFLQWSPYPLAIVAKMLGDEGLERRFHALFRVQHSHREWFRPSPALDLTIAQIVAGAFDLDSLPPPQIVTVTKGGMRISEESRLSMSWTHRLHWLRKRGVEIPPLVATAAFRWGAGKYYHDYDPHNPADREVVEAFLENHPRLRARKAA